MQNNTEQIIEIVIGYINPQMVYELVFTFIAVLIVVYIFKSDIVSGSDKEKVDKAEEARRLKVEALRRANDRIRQQNELRKNLHSKGRG
ncbi:MAG: hypothetical protein OIF32_05380 [Campylobacterales bacterium]|nr:hypothetical protein [Campylobacterales bacterium]